MSGLILEGVCGSGKSTLLRALLASPRYIERAGLSSVVLTEHHTQRVLEAKEGAGGLMVADNLALLNGHVRHVEGLRERLDVMPWRAEGRTKMRIPFVFERFHLTHVCHYPHMHWEHVRDIDMRLAAMETKLCLLTVKSKVLEQRILSRRDSLWQDYLKRQGDTLGPCVRVLGEQQRQYLAMCQESAMEALVLDTTDQDQEGLLNVVLDFWGAV